MMITGTATEVLRHSGQPPWSKLSTYNPPALQLPADPHDTESIAATPRVLSAAATSVAFPQAPFVSLMTNACVPRELSV